MMYRIETDTPTDKIAEKLAEAAKTQGFGVMQTLVLSSILQSKGIDFTGDITIYEICNPKYAHKVITEDPSASVYLPCRLSVSKTGEKSVLITNDLAAMMQADTMVSDMVKVHLTEVFEKIKKIMAML